MTLALAFFVLFIMGAVGGWALWDLTAWSAAAVAIIIIVIIGVCGFVLFLVANGDWIAWREIVRTSRNQEKAITEHADLLRQAEGNRHTEEMARLDIQKTQVQIDGRLTGLTMQMEDVKRHLLTLKESPDITPANFVEADPDAAAARTVALNYAVSLYKRPAAGGMPDPDKVYIDGRQPGRIRGETPFSKRGRWGGGVSDEVGQRAADMLFLPDNGAPPVIRAIANGYALNLDAYPTRQSVWQKFA